MLGGHFIGAVHAPPLFPGSSTPCSPTGWSNPAARPACTRPILAAYSAGTAVVPGRSTLPAKPSCRATQIAPIHDHGESCPRALPGADSHTPRPVDPLIQTLHRPRSIIVFFSVVPAHVRWIAG